MKASDLEKFIQYMSLNLDEKITDGIVDFSFPHDFLITFTGLNCENLISLRDAMLRITSLRMTSKYFRFFKFILGFFWMCRST